MYLACETMYRLTLVDFRHILYKWRIDLLFDDAVLSQQQVQPTSQRATCRFNALLPANQNQAFLNEVE